jgi:dimethylargininase
MAVLFGHGAVLTRPGAISRQGEVAPIRSVLSKHYSSFYAITPPATLDGGDICEAGRHFFIGISERTNPEGARQLSGFLENEGYTCALIDIRKMKGFLHLKSGMAYLGDNRLVLIDALAQLPEFQAYERVRIKPHEHYAANCVRVNDYVLMAAGYPEFAETLQVLGYDFIALEMTEFQKMDGGLSCLSLRF